MRNDPLSPLPELALGRYRHFKNGKEYEVVGLARHSETLEPMVIYKALYAAENRELGELWARPYAMFVEEVAHEGRRVKRFQCM